MTDKRLRTLVINTNVIKRIIKEKSRYEEEVVKYTENYDSKVAAQAEEHDIKMAKAILDESKMMIPDCQSRLSKAIKELECALEECEEFKDTAEYKQARDLLQECLYTSS
ncbi:Tubulin-specific chaperone A [Schistosoma japonicum]|uniref:Tubulin-specific chaperone A n=2 Tax=Schistosoma japonicum TaxID=6182 RepID=A0A4Z2CZA3_SCHJA|nr:Tubulin-specific chaperone A [Schistosoma japonicum]TNN09567.1 Tubulin-specific chaperone A [Schistosoma japonicum]